MSEEPIFRYAAKAMATRFEIALWGRDEITLRAAAETALEEIHAIERRLSFYREDSEVRELNIHAAYEPIPVDPRLFKLLRRSKELSALVDGAFDITVAPLLRAWGFVGASGSPAEEDELQAARELVGMELIELDETSCTVRFLKEGVMIDLGAIGKGYAVDVAGDILRDLEIPGALIHGGTSTILAIGAQPNGSPWIVAVRNPLDSEDETNEPLALVPLIDRSLSISAPHGKAFIHDGQLMGHVLDPRTGSPVQGNLLAAVTGQSAMDTDALSTGLLVLGEDGLNHLKQAGEYGGLVASPIINGPSVASFDIN
jgi:thiamine biosynthesis lipoprotein